MGVNGNKWLNHLNNKQSYKLFPLEGEIPLRISIFEEKIIWKSSFNGIWSKSVGE